MLEPPTLVWDAVKVPYGRTNALLLDYSYVMYQFRMKHRGIHNIVDAAMLMGGPIAREITSILFLLTWM